MQAMAVCTLQPLRCRSAARCGLNELDNCSHVPVCLGCPCPAARHSPQCESQCVQTAPRSNTPDASALQQYDLGGEPALRYVLLDGCLVASLSSPVHSTDGLYVGPLDQAPPEAAAELVSFLTVPVMMMMMMMIHEHI